MLNDILDLSKIEAGKLDFETIDFNLRDTLEDAIRVRAMLFSLLDGVHVAELQAFRTLPNDGRELVLVGTVFRDDKLPARNTSLAMQAKLLGFHFTVADGYLIRLGDHTDPSPDTRFGTSYPTHLKEVS